MGEGESGRAHEGVCTRRGELQCKYNDTCLHVQQEGQDPDEIESGCSDRWQNMKEQVTGKAWGMYEETGIFLSLCRHGFVLLIADMVRSGEL